MGCCRVCKGELTVESGRERCRNPHCWTNMFSEGAIVRSHRHPESGIGRVTGFPQGPGFARVRYLDGAMLDEPCADLRRHELPKGSLVSVDGRSGRITGSGTDPGRHGFIYRISLGTEEITAGETDVHPAALSATEAAREGAFSSTSELALRLKAVGFRLAQAGDGMMCVHNSRVELMRHQVKVAHAAVQLHGPRLILADEVGLGKTMEAGLILKEMKARGLADRVLVIVPSTLVPQWVAEMRGKFNEAFEVYDSAKVRSLRYSRAGENPWSVGTNIITSLQYARKDGIRALIAEAHWDLVIFDEAHHLRRKLDGREVRMTKAYRLAEKLRDTCASMLLLTATPLQLQAYEFFSLLELIEPGRFRDYGQFEEYRRVALPAINPGMRLLATLGGRSPTQEERNSFEATVKALHWLRQNMESREPLQPLDGWLADMHRPEWRRAIFAELEEHQVVGRCMLRNRKADVFPGGPRRRAVTIQLQLTADEKRAYELVSTYVRRGYSKALQDRDNALGFVMMVFQKLLTSSRAALISAFRNRIERLREGERAPTEDLHEDIADFDLLEEAQQDELLARLYSIRSFEDEIAVLGELCAVLSGIGRDTKAESLVSSIDSILAANPSEKVLVFTQFHATQEYLRAALSPRYNVTVFNGRMSQPEKEAAISRFRDSAQVMISTEAGGEGRNFQFAHIMFNYDLPWNPMRVEQRIGRLDRIGQTKVVNIYNFSYGDTVEQRILDALYERIGLFEETIGAMEPILGDVEREIADLLLRDIKDLDRAIDVYRKTLEERISEARDIERRLEDFSMDTRAFQMERLDALLARRPAVTSDMLRRFIIDLVTRHGGVVTDAFGDMTTIRVPQDFSLNRSCARVLRGTFSLDHARANESVEFIAFGHPFIDDCLDAAIGEPYAPMVSRARASEVPKGALFVFLAELSDLRRTRKLIPVFIPGDGTPSDELSHTILSLVISGKASPPEGGLPAADLARHEAAAEAAAIRQIATMVDECRVPNSEAAAKEAARLERLYTFKERKLEDQIARDNNRLQKMLASGEDRYRKVIPAIQGRIDKARKELDGLGGERAMRMAELKKRLDFGERHRVVGVVIFD